LEYNKIILDIKKGLKMKLFIALCITLFTGVVYADYIEVKQADGTSYSSSSNGLHVCYDKRIKVVVDGDMYLSYRGCTREDIKCSRIGKVHFGKYPTRYKASQALNRCRNSRPRFVD